MRIYDEDYVEDLNAEQWQLDLLKLNPEYVFWGNYEDYMADKDAGWASAGEFDSFSEMFGLDELNECVNFYFDVYRKNHECEHCEGSGYNEATKQLSDAWYAFDEEQYIYVTQNKRYNNAAWSNHLTQDEVEALVRAGRLRDFVGACYFDDENQQWIHWVNGEREPFDGPEMPTAEEVNKWNREGIGHDAINRSICIETRAKRLGVYGYCEHCKGKGRLYDEDKAKVGLQLWILHPRKGCSKGVFVKNVKKEDLPAVYSYLNEAAERNADRFSKLPKGE